MVSLHDDASTINNVVKFLETIYPSDGEWIATFDGEQNGHNVLKNTRQRFYPNTPEGRQNAAEELLRAAEGGRDAYYGAHLFSANGDRTKNNAAPYVSTLWSESDKARPNGSIPQPSISVESSPGHFHDYWLLTEPIPSEKAEELNRRIAAAMGSDSGWMLSKLLRPPETFNFKREEPAKVRIVSDTGEVYDPAHLDSILPQLMQKPGEASRNEDEPPVKLSEAAMRVWKGEDPKLKATGDVDKSATLMKVGRVLYDAGATRQTIVAALAERDVTLSFEKYCNRPAEYDRIVDKLEQEGRNETDKAYLKIGKGSAPRFPLTDTGNAERMNYLFGEDLHYVSDWQRFLVWDGKRWVQDSPEHLHVQALAQKTARLMYAEASKIADGEYREKLLKHARSSESSSRIRAMVDRLKSQGGILISHTELAENPWLLNVNNGTLNLQTGELQPHKREDHITQLIPTDYVKNAEAPTFEGFLKEILPSKEVRGFVQRMIGYSLNGTTREHKLPIFYGSGANGKGTLLNILLDLLGDYGMQAADELLMARHNAHPTDQADLFRKRFVTNQETEEGQRFNESLIKRMTGGDKIRARRMRENFWQFDPTHTLFLATNHKPIVRNGGNAIWRRLRLVPFTVEIPEARQDTALPEKLHNELEGILSWAVEGHTAWLNDGLQEPEEVTKATNDYRDEMDTLGSFIEDMCVTTPDAWVRAKDLQEAYASWSATNRETMLSPKELKNQLLQRGFEHKRLPAGFHYFGIGLWTPGDDDGPHLITHKDVPMYPDVPKTDINDDCEAREAAEPKNGTSGYIHTSESQKAYSSAENEDATDKADVEKDVPTAAPEALKTQNSGEDVPNSANLGTSEPEKDVPKNPSNGPGLKGKHGEVVSSTALYTWLASKNVSAPAEDTPEYWESWAEDLATVPGFPLAESPDPDELRSTVMRILERGWR